MKKLIIGGTYRHYKGFVVKVLGEAVHTETGEPLVIYIHLEDGAVWGRSKKMFLETILKNGKKIERFKNIPHKILVRPNRKK